MRAVRVDRLLAAIVLALAAGAAHAVDLGTLFNSADERARLDLVEMVGALRAKHELFSLDYEVAPQRPLQLPGGRVYSAVDILSSRVRVRMRALHEGDVVGFVEDLGQSRQGFYPLDRCLLRRVEVAAADALQPRVEAECAFEWITLRDKNANRAG